MSDANDLADFIHGYLNAVCDSYDTCDECPFFCLTPHPFFPSSTEHCRINYANCILDAKGLNPLW